MNSDKLLPIPERECKRSRLCQNCKTREGIPDWWVELGNVFFTELETEMAHIRPAGRRLTQSQEEILARYCIVLALFEQLSRNLSAGTHSPLFIPEPKTSLSALLTIARPDWIKDLCTLSWLFYDCCHDLLSKEAILNPTFDGSHDVGGADADLIVQQCLIDIKTTRRPHLETKWLYQLIGYALLDYSDHYQLNEVAFYLSRQGLFLKWPLDELLTTMTGQANPNLNDLRVRFKNIAKAPRNIR